MANIALIIAGGVRARMGYKLGKLIWAYTKAFEEKIGIYGSSYTNTMMVELGERLYFRQKHQTDHTGRL